MAPSSQPKTSPKNTSSHNNKTNTSPKSNITQKANRVGDGSRIPTTGQSKSIDTNLTTRNTDKNGKSGEMSDNTAYANESVNNSPTHLQTTILSNTKPNYATATAKENNPQRDQAIIFNSIEGIPQIDYIRAIGQIVSPKNILFVSRISNNRFCIFLNSKHTVDSLVENTKFITINDNVIQIRRLINSAKRIVISNVCPSIPNEKILAALLAFNITPTSQINYIRAGVVMEGYEHVLSFRRQIYINENDIPKLPGSLVINHNETNFRIFFTDDRITCYTCKTSGHTTLSCKKFVKNSNNNVCEYNSTPENQKTDLIDFSQPPISSPMLITTDETHPNWNNATESSALKRQAPPTTTSSAPTSPTAQEPPLLESKHNHKKVKTAEQTTASNNSPTNQESPLTQTESTNKPENRSRSNSRKRFSEDLDTHLDPISQIFNEFNHTSLNFSQFKHIIEMIATLDHPLDTIHEYETTGNHIMELLEKIRPSLLTVKAKNNITRITSKLFKALENEASMDASSADSVTY